MVITTAVKSKRSKYTTVLNEQITRVLICQKLLKIEKQWCVKSHITRVKFNPGN